MNTIGQVTCGIKALEGVLNNLVAAINRRTVDTGPGLTKKESDSGVIIDVAQGSKAGGDGTPSTSGGAWLTTPDGETAGWHQVTVVDDACNQLKMWVWGGTPGGNPA